MKAFYRCIQTLVVCMLQINIFAIIIKRMYYANKLIIDYDKFARYLTNHFNRYKINQIHIVS